MNTKLFNAIAAAMVLMLSCLGSRAQSLVYSNNISSLSPAGYWPMHEAEAPAGGDIETNYGSLGLQGTGYYPDYQVNVGAFLHGYPGALANDPDQRGKMGVSGREYVLKNFSRRETAEKYLAVLSKLRG